MHRPNIASVRRARAAEERQRKGLTAAPPSRPTPQGAAPHLYYGGRWRIRSSTTADPGILNDDIPCVGQEAVSSGRRPPVASDLHPNLHLIRIAPMRQTSRQARLPSPPGPLADCWRTWRTGSLPGGLGGLGGLTPDPTAPHASEWWHPYALQRFATLT
eukprot:gene13442-biopygen6546